MMSLGRTLVLGLVLAGSAFANPVLIRELESLRNGLPYKDASRPEVTLRLADVYFNHAVELNSKGLDPAKERRRAQELYEEALSGQGGLYAAPGGMKRLRIEFQIARLAADLNQDARAKGLFAKLAAQNDSLEIRRDSALRMAELVEEEKTNRAQAEAEKYYSEALELCGGGADLCSYIQYRRAWVKYRQDNLQGALADLRKSLFDSKGQVRDEALRDLLNFLAHGGGDGQDALVEVEQLSTKIARPEIVLQLAESFYALGNRYAGTFVLAHVNTKSPRLRHEARLLEEYYGLRNWKAFRETLAAVSEHATPEALADAEEKATVEKFLRRLSIQLDGERQTRPETVADFQSVVMVYLKVFPTGDLRARMIDGWLVSEKDEAKKMSQLATWIGEEHGLNRTAEEIRLRKTRASLAQKRNEQSVVVGESLAIAALTKDATEKRKYEYTAARALYAQKDYDKALPMFAGLASVNAAGQVDDLAIQSQNLVLDIHGQRKNYAGLLEQVNLWTANPALKKAAGARPELAKELKEMSDIAEQTRFEEAVAMGATPAALDTFKDYCLGGKFADKACPNARGLAAKLGDEPALIAILKHEKRTDDLLVELEAAGHFDEAARGLETKGPKTFQEWMKVALLYELGGKLAERNRVLQKVWSQVSGWKTMGENEALVYQTFKDAGMLGGMKDLDLPWSQERRVQMAHDLEARGLRTEKTRALVLSSAVEMGPAWGRRVLEIVEPLDVAQRKVGFYGKNSKKKFNDRVAAIGKLKAGAVKYLEGASAVTRVKLAAVLARAYGDLAAEIQKTPMPEGLDEATLQGLAAALAEMATPFANQAKGYQELFTQQLAKVNEVEERARLQGLLTDPKGLEGLKMTEDKVTVTQGASPLQSKEMDLSLVAPALDQLHRDPLNEAALTQLKVFYESKGLLRVASYFQGRLKSLEAQKKSREAAGNVEMKQ